MTEIMFFNSRNPADQCYQSTENLSEEDIKKIIDIQAKLFDRDDFIYIHKEKAS